MGKTPARRKDDSNGYMLGAIKATVAFIFFGALSFVGTWSVGVSKSIAELREFQAATTERDIFLSTWLVDEMKASRTDIKELRKELSEMKGSGRRR